MGRSNANVIPIHRRLHKKDNRRLMQFEQEELTYDLAHDYQREIEYWGRMVDEQIIKEVFHVPGCHFNSNGQIVKPKVPWWRRLMAWMGVAR